MARDFVKTEVFGLFSRLQVWSFFIRDRPPKQVMFLKDECLRISKRSDTFTNGKIDGPTAFQSFLHFFMKIEDFQEIAWH